MDAPFKLMRQDQFIIERATSEKPSIMSMAINSTEDKIFFTSSNNQLSEFNVSLDGIDNECSFSPVIFDFHSSKITGLDVCI